MKLQEILEDIGGIVLILILILWLVSILLPSVSPQPDVIYYEDSSIEEISPSPVWKHIRVRQLTLPIPEPKVEEWKIPDNPYILEIEEVAKSYDIVDDLDLLIYAMIQVESNFQPNLTSSAGCIGLMQVSPYWQSDRATKLGVDDLWDPYSNILVGVDLLEDLYYNYAHRDIVLAVMMYNMNFERAKYMYYTGKRSQYAVDVFRIFDELKGG